MIDAGRPPQRIAIGCVRKPCGLQGYCYVDAFGKALPALKLPAAVFLGADPFGAVESMLREKKETPKGYLCRFNDHETIEQAETIRGVYIFIEQRDLPALKGKEYYAFELEGMSVLAVPGNTPVGVVVEVQNYPTVDALTVRREDASTILVVLRREIIVAIDREKRCIFVQGSALEEEF
jgi:16S rRNA processing protein RimM